MKINRILVARAVVGASLVGGALYKAREVMFQVRDCCVSYDPVFSELACAAIDDYLKDVQSRGATSLTSMNEQIQKAFPHIDSIASLFLLPEKVHLSIKAAQPKLCINNQFVLSERKTYFDKAIFAPAALAALPVVDCRSLSPDGQLPAGLRGVGRWIDERVACQYSIVWYSDQAACLRDKQETNFVVLCSADSMPSDQTLSHCQALKQRLVEARSLKNESPMQWIADVRFNNQIIVYSQKRGVPYG
jgi:hypothetical protein